LAVREIRRGLLLRSGPADPRHGAGGFVPRSRVDQAGPIAENFDVFDFELSREEIAAIDALDTGVRGGPDRDSITLKRTARKSRRREV